MTVVPGCWSVACGFLVDGRQSEGRGEEGRENRTVGLEDRVWYNSGL